MLFIHNDYIRRWDTHAHRLADFNTADPSMEIFPGKFFFHIYCHMYSYIKKGQDYSDARLRDFEQGKF